MVNYCHLLEWREGSGTKHWNSHQPMRLQSGDVTNVDIFTPNNLMETRNVYIFLKKTLFLPFNSSEKRLGPIKQIFWWDLMIGSYERHIHFRSAWESSDRLDNNLFSDIFYYISPSQYATCRPCVLPIVFPVPPVPPVPLTPIAIATSFENWRRSQVLYLDLYSLH